MEPVKTLLILTNARGGGTVAVEVEPDMNVSDLAEKLKEEGVVRREESVIFGKIDEEDGRFKESTVTKVRDLIEAADAGEIVAFQADRMHGSLVKLLFEHVKLLFEHGYRYNPVLEGYTAIYKSRYDGKRYRIVIKLAKTPDIPPSIIIAPYPDYVREDPKFKKTHASLCLFSERRPSGVEIGKWHIDRDNWNEIIREGRNPLISVLNSLNQLLELYPTYQWGVTND